MIIRNFSYDAEHRPISAWDDMADRSDLSGT
jgi:hypothetical protein